jgi:putative ABC transport system substrate-binding protein
MFGMRRREFITLLGGAAVAPSLLWPLAARAQQADRVRRIVFLHALAENDPEAPARVVAFRQGLEALGWVENRNIQIAHRFSGGDFDRMQAYTAELVRSTPDLIVASSSPVIAALKQATRTIPIVFSLVNDPLGQGFIANQARPGANITGFTFVDFPMIGKWLELLKEIAPGVTRIMLIFNPQTAPYYPVFLREFGAAAASLATELSAAPVRDGAEIEAAAAALAREPGGGLIAAPDPFVNAHRGVITALSKRHRLPAIYGFRRYVTEGALMSYGPDTVDIVRRSASYVDRILKGESPADLPVQSPTKYELAINFKTAKTLGLDVPPTLLARADEVIE